MYGQLYSPRSPHVNLSNARPPTGESPGLAAFASLPTTSGTTSSAAEPRKDDREPIDRRIVGIRDEPEPSKPLSPTERRPDVRASRGDAVVGRGRIAKDGSNRSSSRPAAVAPPLEGGASDLTPKSAFADPRPDVSRRRPPMFGVLLSDESVDS